MTLLTVLSRLRTNNPKGLGATLTIDVLVKEKQRSGIVASLYGNFIQCQTVERLSKIDSNVENAPVISAGRSVMTWIARA